MDWPSCIVIPPAQKSLMHAVLYGRASNLRALHSHFLFLFSTGQRPNLMGPLALTPDFEADHHFMPCFVFELRYLPGLNEIIWLAAGQELEFAKIRSLISWEDNQHGGK